MRKNSNQVRKLLPAIALAASLLPATAHAQSAGGYATQSVEAHVNWFAGRSAEGSPLFRFVAVSRDTDVVGGTDTIAQVGKVRCVSSSARSSFLYNCSVSGRLLFLKTRDFEFDNALRSARVVFEIHGQRNRIDWTGNGKQPKPSWSLQGGERALVANGSVTAGSQVRGSVLGDRFSNKRKKARATLRRGAEVGVLYETGVRTFRVRGSSAGAAWRKLRAAIDSL